jgi:hypothetical protein
MRVVGDDGVVYTAAIAYRPLGTDNEGKPVTFETIIYPSGRTLEYLQEHFGPEVYIVMDPA